MADDNLEGKSANEALLNEILSDPELRPAVLKKLQAKDPSKYFPEVAIDNRMDQRFTDFDKAVKAEVKSQLDEFKFNANLEASKTKLVEKHGADKVAKVEEFMKENGIGKYEAALKLYDQTQVAAAPTPSLERTRLTLPQHEKNMERLGQDPNGWSRDAAYEAVNELLRNKQN